jgi:hypothetical protein
MKLPRIKTVFLGLLGIFAVFYLAAAVFLGVDDRTIEPLPGTPRPLSSVVIFGASGTAGDGILKAVLASPDVASVLVLTRRVTPRMDEGVASGKLEVIEHLDYLDYAAVIDRFAAVETVYWAIGISSLGVDEETYGRIHVDFPMAFVAAWNELEASTGRSFHFISSSDISEGSGTMWVREKIRAEKALFGFADQTDMKVIAYRPDYIGPTAEEGGLGQNLLYGFFAPVGAALRALQIGQAMIEVTVRGEEFNSGDKLGTSTIIRYSDSYERRVQSAKMR